MCGICGIIHFDQSSVAETDICQMMRMMKHRGPDDEGVFINGNIGLGFVRLSILDLSPSGHQPMYSHDNRYVIVYNGEVYNYIELRNELKQNGFSFKTGTDTEVVLAAYQLWGEDCLNRFNGMWAFVIYDTLQKTVFASRDRYGIKPFYYVQNDRMLAFASEIPPLLQILPGKPSPDNQSIFDYLVFNRTDQTEHTFYKEIKKLQHGHILYVSNQSLTNRRWYHLQGRVDKAQGFNSPEEFKEYFSSAVGLRLRSDVPVGVCLSGGLDSSSIVAILLNDYQKNDLQTFSATYQQGQLGDETQFINELSPLLNHMHYINPSAESLYKDLQAFVKAHAEPIPATGPYAQYKVMELAKGNVVVTLDGQGADEELAGYHYFFGFFFKDLLKQLRIGKLTSEMLSYLNKHQSLYGLKSFIYFLLPQKMRTLTRISEKGYVTKEFSSAYMQQNAVAGNLYGSSSLQDSLINHFEYKLEHLLKWEDRNSMAFSIEARVPFLDYRLVEKLLASSNDMMINKGMTKHILREAMNGQLPEAIRLRRDKIGFGTPQDEWFREKAWQISIREVLHSDSFSSRRIIDTQKAQAIYKQHLTGKGNYSKEIWKWMHLEMWFREFID